MCLSQVTLGMNCKVPSMSSYIVALLQSARGSSSIQPVEQQNEVHLNEVHLNEVQTIFAAYAANGDWPVHEMVCASLL